MTAFTQGIVVSGFGTLPSAEALFLRCDWPENGPDSRSSAGKGAWLQALDDRRADHRRGRQGSARRHHRVHLDRPAETGASGRRARHVLGAVSRGHVPGGPAAPSRRQDRVTNGRAPSSRAGRAGAATFRRARNSVHRRGSVRSLTSAARRSATSGKSSTPITVHALLLLYEKDEDTAQALGRKRSRTALAAHGVKVVAPAAARPPARRQGHRPRAFRLRRRPVAADSLRREERRPGARPTVSFSATASRPRAIAWHGVPLGEILLGHTNAHHEKAPGPMVPSTMRTRAHRA